MPAGTYIHIKCYVLIFSRVNNKLVTKLASQNDSLPEDFSIIILTDPLLLAWTATASIKTKTSQLRGPFLHDLPLQKQLTSTQRPSSSVFYNVRPCLHSPEGHELPQHRLEKDQGSWSCLTGRPELTTEMPAQRKWDCDWELGGHSWGTQAW